MGERPGPVGTRRFTVGAKTNPLRVGPSAATQVALLAVLALPASAQDHRPMPSGTPEALIHPALRVNVFVHEDIDPDQLRGLARPQVVLWLRTRSNALRRSSVEHLARFEEAWVQLRPPIRPAELGVLPFPVGVWLELPIRVPARRLALELQRLDPAVAEATQAARPAVLRWSPEKPPDVLQWSLFHQLPGRRIYVPPPDGLLPMNCEVADDRAPSAEVHSATLLSLGSHVFPCGRGTRVVIEPTVDHWLLQSLLAREPSLELIVVVGADSERASQARRLLTDLGLTHQK